jgi:hypothetical protein
MLLILTESLSESIDLPVYLCGCPDPLLELKKVNSSNLVGLLKFVIDLLLSIVT